jgi:hypothetical protein
VKRVWALLLATGVVCAGQDYSPAEIVVSKLQTNFVAGGSTTSETTRVRVNFITGMAVIHTRPQPGKQASRFCLDIKGAVPNATLELKINGTDLGTITTDASGRLRLHGLPGSAESGTVTLMELNDPTGTNALTINF